MPDVLIEGSLGVIMGDQSQANALKQAVKKRLQAVEKVIKTTINKVGAKISRKQLRHIAGRKEWIAKGKGGYFNSIKDAQAVLDALHSGSAKLLSQTKQGHIPEFSRSTLAHF